MNVPELTALECPRAGRPGGVGAEPALLQLELVVVEAGHQAERAAEG